MISTQDIVDGLLEWAEKFVRDYESGDYPFDWEMFLYGLKDMDAMVASEDSELDENFWASGGGADKWDALYARIEAVQEKRRAS